VLHAVLVGLHAAAGVTAFAAGVIAISARRSKSAFAAYQAGLVALGVFLAVLVAVDWTGLGAGLQAGFAALTALAGYLVWRAEAARRLFADKQERLPARYFDHVGFTLVALFDGFAIIVVVVNGGPGWAAGLVGAAGVAAGHRTIRRLKRRLGDRTKETEART
jgi:hypothetical protein